MVIRPEPTDLCELVRGNVNIHTPAVDRPQPAPRRPPAGHPVIVVVDSDRVSQVLSNLVANAIKFTPDEGGLGIALDVEDGDAVLRVSDAGIGISEDDRERLFERFFRAGNAVEQAIPGTGLGLAICKGIVDAHGGALAVVSELGSGRRSRCGCARRRAATRTRPPDPCGAAAAGIVRRRGGVAQDHRSAGGARGGSGSGSRPPTTSRSASRRRSRFSTRRRST